jgi:hypothetical protein
MQKRRCFWVSALFIARRHISLVLVLTYSQCVGYATQFFTHAVSNKPPRIYDRDEHQRLSTSGYRLRVDHPYLRFLLLVFSWITPTRLLTLAAPDTLIELSIIYRKHYLVCAVFLASLALSGPISPLQFVDAPGGSQGGLGHRVLVSDKCPLTPCTRTGNTQPTQARQKGRGLAEEAPPDIVLRQGPRRWQSERGFGTHTTLRPGT